MYSPNRLRELRQERGMVQVQLAVLVGVSPSTIGNIEKYGYPPQAGVAERIADVLGLAVSDIWAPVEDEAAVA